MISEASAEEKNKEQSPLSVFAFERYCPISERNVKICLQTERRKKEEGREQEDQNKDPEIERNAKVFPELQREKEKVQ